MLNFETGKYGFFIWTAYGLTIAVFAAMIVGVILKSRRWKQRYEALTRK
jgi:heme exporter protein CcmD